MFKIFELANDWFSRFPYFIVNFCSDFAVEKRNRKSAFNCAILSFSYSEQCKFTANSLQISTLKKGNLENQTFVNSKILNI